MENFAFCAPSPQQNRRIVKARDLHWIKWSFSSDRWGFSLQSKWYLNTLLAYFCSVINAYSKQGQRCDGIDVPLDWLLERVFGPTLSRATLKRALDTLKTEGWIDCPRKRPGNTGKRIIFSKKLSDIGLHGSRCTPSDPNKDRKVISNRQVNQSDCIEKKTVPAQKKQSIDPVLKSLLIAAEKMGVDELGLKRLFRICSTELERLGAPAENKNLVDWKFYRSKWRGMSFVEREGCARVDILPLFIPKKEPEPDTNESPEEIRAIILKSLGYA